MYGPQSMELCTSYVINRITGLLSSCTYVTPRALYMLKELNENV